MNICVTGGAGFIGSQIAKRLLAEGHQVKIIDNFSTGLEFFLKDIKSIPELEIKTMDLANLEDLKRELKEIEVVFHIAANADVRSGPENTGKDLQENTINTYNVLEAMRVNGVSEIIFSSTGSVYGECELIPTPENAPFPIQNSLYGASKVAGECLIQSFCEAFNMRGCIFRFVSILGECYTHGHVWDFYFKLKKDPTRLAVLGNGKQRKSYLYIEDCIDALMLAWKKHPGKVDVYNLGREDFVDVQQSIGVITDYLQCSPSLHYSSDQPSGWIGDSSFILLDIKKIKNLGWEPKVDIPESIRRTLDYIRNNEQEIYSGGNLQ